MIENRFGRDEGPSGALSLCLVLACAALLTACGAPADAGIPGTGGSTTSRIALEIRTTSLPGAHRGAGYGPLMLEAEGAAGPVEWEVASGALPPGMALTSDGAVSGTPQADGFYPFTVAASDGYDEDLQTLAIAVETFGVFVSGGLRHGDAWSHHGVTVETAGRAGTVTFEVLRDGSGGTWCDVDPDAGVATYMPGEVAVPGVVDVLRVTDVATGTSQDITLEVAPDPLDEHDAEFGLCDVWFVDFEHKSGTHAYATDWHAQLARLGLRDPTSTGRLGTDVDQLADMCCRVAVLRSLNEVFLREQDGTMGDGLQIAFPYEAPPAPYVKPTAGSLISGRENGYSVMAVCEGSATGRVGMAMLDFGNGHHENNTPSGSGEFGVFVNRIVDRVIHAYDAFGDTLVLDPVGPADVDALKAILYGAPSPGGRFALLDYVIDGLGRSVGSVCAHEIGHSLGLEHTNPTTPGSIMNYTSTIHESAEYAFLPEDLEILRRALPGSGRGGIAPLEAAAPIPEGGVCTCADH